MTKDNPRNPRSARIGVALAVLLTGTAIGFALRLPFAADSGTDSPGRGGISAGRASSAARPAGTESRATSRSRSLDRPPAAVTLSAEQWAKVVANPSLYELDIKKLRTNAAWGPRVPLTAHAELFGWNETTVSEVADVVGDFNRRLIELEKAQSDVTYTELSPAGSGMKIDVTYPRMAEAVGRLVEDLQGGLREFLGAKDAARFASVANLSGIEPWRDATIRDELIVYFKSGTLTLMRELTGSVDQLFTRSISQEQIHQLGPTFTSAAVDWEHVIASLNPSEHE